MADGTDALNANPAAVWRGDPAGGRSEGARARTGWRSSASAALRRELRRRGKAEGP